jgi:hypothetical protein
MKDEELADEIIARLNKLCEDPKVRLAIGRLLDKRVVVSKEVAAHPTIQVANMSHASVYGMGFIGLVNGLVGTIQSGKFEGWGFICASWDGEGEESCIPENFRCFKRVVELKVNPATGEKDAR